MATLALTYYSDVLCVWAHIAQARVDEAKLNFQDQIAIDYRFCSVFGDTADKIGRGWNTRGGYEGFANHVKESLSRFDHVTAHPKLWQQDPPASSNPAHLLMKAVQKVEPAKCEATLLEIRRAFFDRALNIARWSNLEAIAQSLEIPLDSIKDVLHCGVAHADLEADRRDQQTLMVQGSPTFILNEGRQKLYGNVGYGVIEANIRELLRSPVAGAASWC